MVIHTGDFKVDYTPLSGDAVTDLPTIAEYGRKGVLALLADSTNAERPGFTATEQTVAEGVRRLFAKAGKRRIIVATFASNIYRVQQIIDLAIESGRKVAVSGRSMVSNTEMARELGYLHAPDNVLITIDEINKSPPEKVVLITTGAEEEQYGYTRQELADLIRKAGFPLYIIGADDGTDAARAQLQELFALARSQGKEGGAPGYPGDQRRGGAALYGNGLPLCPGPDPVLRGHRLDGVPAVRVSAVRKTRGDLGVPTGFMLSGAV